VVYRPLLASNFKLCREFININFNVTEYGFVNNMELVILMHRSIYNTMSVTNCVHQ